VSKKSRDGSASNPGWFPKGRSGNPKGRPKKSREAKGSAFQVLLDKTLTVPDRGGTREILFEKALQLRTFQNALDGKAMAIREVLKWIRKREAWLAKHQPEAHKPIPLLHSPDPDNADAALVLLGIAAPNPIYEDLDPSEIPSRAWLLLEPWAARAALRRRRGGQRLTERQVSELRRCTRDWDSLGWPRRTGR
jgi:Family of unknown function (DUF5681)